jgi:hypothetical protein
MMDTTNERELTAMAGEDLERELRSYAGVRLSPDRFASHRMRTAVMEHARVALPAASTVPHRLDVLASLRLGTRRLAPIALVAALAVGAGTAAGVAASPGGPLYGVRVWAETAFLPAGGQARADAQEALLNERLGEISGAVGAGNDSAANAASDAYNQEMGQAVATAARRADLLQLRATIARHLAHLQSLARPTDKASGQLQRLIASTQAALATVDAKIAALPTPTP